MLFANLRNALKDEIKPAYELKGSDIFLINKSVELILTAAKVAPMNVVRFDETATPGEVDAASRNQSLFGGPVAVVVCTPEHTRVILAPNTKTPQAVDCNPMTPDLVTKLIVNQFAAAGKKITPAAAATLASAQGNNYALVNNEISKLCAYYADRETITAEDLHAIISKTEDYQIYELGSALLKQNADAAERIYKNLTACGVDDYAVFASLLSQTRRLFYALTSAATDAELAAFFKVHPYAITASRRDGKHLRGKIAQIYETALRLEYEIKSGRLTAPRAVTLLKGSLL